jgi:hypothetical protein
MRCMGLCVLAVLVLAGFGCTTQRPPAATAPPSGRASATKPSAAPVVPTATGATPAPVARATPSSSAPAKPATPPTAVKPAVVAAKPAAAPAPLPQSAKSAPVPPTSPVLFAIGQVPAATDRAEPRHAKWRALSRFADAAAEQRLLDLVTRRAELTQHAAMLGRLLEEKAAQIAGVEAQLKDGFGIAPDLFYEFDAAKKEILLVEAAKEGAVVKKPVRRLGTDAEATRFVTLASARKLGREQVASIRLLIQDRGVAAQQAEAELSKSFAVVRERQYLYDPKVKTLYERETVE